MASPMFDELTAAARSAGYQMAIADVVAFLRERTDLTSEQRWEISLALARLEINDRRAIEAQDSVRAA